MSTKTTTKDYDNDAIVSLKGADRVRKKPEVVFGSRDLEGCIHAFFEILANALDESRAGHGKLINVTVFNDHSIEVEDFGRGIPLAYNEVEKEFNWYLIFCELYAGGKYKESKEASNYIYSLGTNGLGACATQYASRFMNVRSYKKGVLYEIKFEKGEPVTELKTSPIEGKNPRSGTVIHWKPDNTVFTSISIPLSRYIEILKSQAVVNPSVKFVFKWQEENGDFTTQVIQYENGIIDYIKELSIGKGITEPMFFEESVSGYIDKESDEANDTKSLEKYNLYMSFAFCICDQHKIIEYYHNSSYLDYGGAPEKAVQNAFVSSVDKYLKDKNKYNKNETRITFADISDCLVLVTNCFSDVVSYENQTKRAITDKYIRDCMTTFIKESLDVYLTEHPIDAERIASSVIVNKRSRETAEANKINIRKRLSGNIDIANRIDKFVNCRSKDPNVRELYIVEGDSAMSSCKLARNAEFQAIIPVRGKTLNCLKSTYEKIFANDIITDLLKVIGCGVEIDKKVKGNFPVFNPDELKWNRIIICTDADEDGFQIRTLILTMFYRLLPSLIKMGRIYIAESPLFEITCKNKIYFAYDEREKNAIVKSFGNDKYTLQRSKGLGENEPEMMEKTTMHPATRRLIKITEADAAETNEIFETLLGDNIASRKEYIAAYGSQYLIDADI